MQESTFTNYDQLPLFLNANTVAQVLGPTSVIPATAPSVGRCG